ncbi:MAG: Uma2 family endonuclease, partial [Bacillota bacterium]
GTPELVIEIISPFSQRRDRLEKLETYQTNGVQHYWLVHPEQKTLECFALVDGVYSRVAGGMDDDVVSPPGFADLQINLKDLWQR